MPYNPEVVSQQIAEALEARGRGAKVQLARTLNVSAQTVSKWISGHTQPLPERWRDIEIALDLPEGHLATLSGFGSDQAGLNVNDQLRAIAEGVEEAVHLLRQLLPPGVEARSTRRPRSKSGR